MLESTRSARELLVGPLIPSFIVWRKGDICFLCHRAMPVICRVLHRRMKTQRFLWAILWRKVNQFALLSYRLKNDLFLSSIETSNARGQSLSFSTVGIKQARTALPQLNSCSSDRSYALSGSDDRPKNLRQLRLIRCSTSRSSAYQLSRENLGQVVSDWEKKYINLVFHLHAASATGLAIGEETISLVKETFHRFLPKDRS